MNKKSKVLVIALILIALSCFTAVNGQDWLFHCWGVHISQEAYFWLAYAIVALAVSMVMLKILRMFRDDRKANNAQAAGVSNETIRNNAVKIYRYSPHSIFLTFFISIILASAPFISDATLKPVPISGYLISLGFSAIVLFYATYMAVFAVYVESANVKIKGLSTRSFQLNEIADVKLRSGKGGERLVVRLESGKIYVFSGALKDFWHLAERLGAHQS